jgi:hypothetical protein
LPENLHVGCYLNLVECTDLTSLPKNLSVDGDLNLTCCTGLKSLPENLSVVGGFWIIGCTGLTSIPRSIKCEGRLIVTDLGTFKTVDEAADAFEVKFGKPQASDSKKQTSYRQQP